MNKIEALKATIINLEDNKTEYDWSTCNHCNCGVVAKTLLNGKLPYEAGLLNSPLSGEVGSGAFSREALCLTTNLPLPLVFQKLKDAGFTHLELQELEWLGNEIILNKIGEKKLILNGISFIKDSKYSNKKTLIKYLKAWVEILEEEQTKTQNKLPEIKEVVKPRERISYVAVPETITQDMKLVMN
jgi:hypothetical protein